MYDIHVHVYMYMSHMHVYMNNIICYFLSIKNVLYHMKLNHVPN